MEDHYSDLELDLTASDELNFLETASSLSLQKPPAEECDEDQFEPGSEEYKKARKRRQNRESATRNRARKKVDYYQLEREIEKLSQENRRLMLENQSLRTENEILKKELSFYQTLIEKPAVASKPPPPSLLTTTLVASLLCVCFFLSSPSTPSSFVKSEGRSLLSVGEVAGESVSKAVVVVALWIGVVWSWKIWAGTDEKPKAMV